MCNNFFYEGFTISYNNGTVFLGAKDPAEALLIKQSLEYDIFEDEESINKNELVEFDLVIGPHASVVAVLEFGNTKINPGKNINIRVHVRIFSYTFYFCRRENGTDFTEHCFSF